MEHTFDVVVIGTGSSANSAAYPLRAAGWSVAVVDYRPFGGTCALRGCDPKRVLTGVAQLVDGSRRMAGKGIAFQELRIDWPALMRLKRSFTDPVPQSSEAAYQRAGIRTFHGKAHFVDASTLQVGSDSLSGRNILIASGARPVRLPIPGAELLTTSDRFLDLDALPNQILFVGGGYISFEFAHLAAGAGAAVRILHLNARPLEGFDPDLVSQLVAEGRNRGIEVEVNARVEALERSGERIVVRTGGEGGSVRHEADMAVHGAGRTAEIDELDLARAGVTRGTRGVSVDEHLQSVSNPRVYACGDAAETPGLPLTPVSDLEGALAARNMLENNRRTLDYSATPSVVYTEPLLARVGLLEEQARSKGLRFRTSHADTTGWFNSRRLNQGASGYKVLIEEGTGRILGAHLLGAHAEEVINLFALAIRFGITTSQLAEMPFVYPTESYDITYMIKG